MNSLADLSIRRPIFITCVVLAMLAVGILSMMRLGVDLFPDVTFPVVTVTTAYPGAGPSEMETLVSKPLEDQISTISGIKRLSSINMEGLSRVVAEFNLEADIKDAEQQVRDHVGSARPLLPRDIVEPVIRRLDPSDQPIVILSLNADLPEGQLYDVADDVIRPRLEQVDHVGLVDVLGGRKREIHVVLDRNKLKQHEISATAIANQLSSAGENTPLGKMPNGTMETVFRSMGEFKSLADIKNTIVSFFGSEVPTTIGDVGTVTDSLQDETSRTFVNGKKGLILYVFRQSGANTIAVADAVKKRIGQINDELKTSPGAPKLAMLRDSSVWIRANVQDVQESILIGIVLAVLVVYFFLGNGRSTLITGLALPNSLIGSFVLMAIAGYTINIMTLLALSLSVGLLIDDAIVVRENIFRHIEMGKPPAKAAREGTAEVRLAVIATTLAIISVFGPVAFLKGMVGQFFKQFGMTICFAMAISLFDALTIAPMLSAYFAGAAHIGPRKGLWGATMGRALAAFDRFQTQLERLYERMVRYSIKKPLRVLGLALIAIIGSCATTVAVPKTFLPPQDAGEFAVGLDLPPGTNLDAMADTAAKVDDVVRANKEVEISAVTVGGRDGEPNVAEFFVKMVPASKRKLNTIDFKEKLRQELRPFAYANPQVKDYDAIGGGMRPFQLDIMGMDEAQLEGVATQAFEKIKVLPGLKDVDTSYRPGKPELDVALDPVRSEELGVSSKMVGAELRAQIEGVTPAKLRESGREYDVRIRLQDDQRDLGKAFDRTYVPNLNMNLVRLADVAKPVERRGPATINRMDRSRYIQISADFAPNADLNKTMAECRDILEKQIGLPPGMRYVFIGQAENFQELGQSMLTAMVLGVLFIFLVLSSLYESFITPYTIMLALPAIAGSFVSLAIARQSLNIFSMIGDIMLMALASKNSILLVDYTRHLVEGGMSRADALVQAGKTRLRPILMTSMALIAGTVPIALGLNEASRQRTSMGVAIIGGLISSTLLTLVVVPAAYIYIDRFREWSLELAVRVFAPKSSKESKEHGNGSARKGARASDVAPSQA